MKPWCMKKKQNGSYGAKAGWHDDRLMTRMFGLHVCHKLPLPRIILPRSPVPSMKVMP